MSTQEDMCRDCLHERFYHQRFTEHGLPPACMAVDCDCWAFTRLPEHTRK